MSDTIETIFVFAYNNLCGIYTNNKIQILHEY